MIRKVQCEFSTFVRIQKTGNNKFAIIMQEFLIRNRKISPNHSNSWNDKSIFFFKISVEFLRLNKNMHCCIFIKPTGPAVGVCKGLYINAAYIILLTLTYHTASIYHLLCMTLYNLVTVLSIWFMYLTCSKTYPIVSFPTNQCMRYLTGFVGFAAANK